MKKFFAGLAVAAVCWSAVLPDKAAQAADRKPFKNIGVEEFDKLRLQTNAVVLDVRTPKEFAAGHIPGAVNIDWNGADFPKKVAALDKSKTYLVQCAVGGRSARASDKMNSLQFTNVFNLEGGIKAWEQAGKPIEK